MSKFIAVISNYAPRGNSLALNLIGQLIDKVDRIILVINDDDCKKLMVNKNNNIIIINRPNSGMNIGAWSEAIKFCDDSEYVIFLQDEFTMIRSDFVQRYISLLEIPGVGMIGESVNYKWNLDWDSLRSSALNYNIKLNDNIKFSRVDYYLHCMKRWGINPGQQGFHLRALAWAFKTHNLKKIGKFPIGTNKEECIAAEIAVSRDVLSRGLQVVQSSEESFYFFEHEEWRKDGFSKKMVL